MSTEPKWTPGPRGREMVWPDEPKPLLPLLVQALEADDAYLRHLSECKECSTEFPKTCYEGYRLFETADRLRAEALRAARGETP